MNKISKGFTLVEIMVVITIIAIITSLSIGAMIKFKKSANEANCQANLKAIGTAFELYAVKNAGIYATRNESNLQYLIDAGCLFHDLTQMNQFGSFQYTVASAKPAGYDIRAIAINPDLSNHNYQITSGAILKRSNTSLPDDTDFKNFQ